MVHVDVLAMRICCLNDDFEGKATDHYVLRLDALNIIISRVMRIEFQDLNGGIVVELILELFPIFDLSCLRILEMIKKQGSLFVFLDVPE